MTNQLKEYGERIGAGSTFAEVSGKQMEEMSINIPKLEEQCKISQLFKQIDNLITLHQQIRFRGGFINEKLIKKK